MLKCPEASALLSDGLDRRLRSGERLRLRLHLLMCRACARSAGQFAFLRKAMERFARRPPG